MEPNFHIGELIGHNQFDDEDFEWDFCIGEQLSYGQFDTVHQCISVSTSKAFTVKTIDKLSDFFDCQMVYSEIKLTILATFGNSRYIQIHRVYEDLAAIYLILDLSPDPDLSYCIIRHEPFCKSWAATVMTNLAKTIIECHCHGIIYRDIRMENILLDSNGTMVLANFYCATLLEMESKTLKEKIGTPSFMAPEMIADKKYDEKVDVWSAGMKGDPLCIPKELFCCHRLE